MKEKDLKYKFFLILFSLAAFLPNLGMKSADVMEARNFASPFPTWITAFTMKIFGDTSTEWILRLPAVLVSILFIIMLYSFITFITKKTKIGFIAALIALSSSFIMDEGVTNTWDIFAYVFAFGYTLYVAKGLETWEVKYFIISSFFLGASLLSKGPVALYGLIIPFFMAYGFIYGIDRLKRNRVSIALSIILGTLIGSSWYIYMLTVHKDLFLQVMNKEFNTWDFRSVNSFLFYFSYLKTTGVWCIFAIASLLLPFKIYIFNKSEKKIYYLGLIWTFISLLLISLVKMKKERYSIPLYMTTPIFIAPVLYYFSTIFYDKMNKIFKNIIFAHWIVLFLINTAIPFLLYFSGVKSNIIPISLVIVFAVISTVFNIALINNFKNKKGVNRFYQLVILTALLGIFFHKSISLLKISG